MTNKKLDDLDGKDSAILNRQGWFLLTYYQARKGNTSSSAYDRAIDKAKSNPRQTGIRTIEKEDYTVFEVWEYWK